MRKGGLFLSFVLAACGSESGTSAPPPAGSATTPPPSGAAKQPAPSSTEPAPTSALDPDPIVGLWTAKGHDTRGDYEGQVEVRASKSGGYDFIRVVRYPKVTVEGGRELHWVFRGTLSKTGAQVSLSSSLKRVDFIEKRNAVKRTAADGPVALSGALTLASDRVTGAITGADVALDDTWSDRKPLPAQPIFVDERKVVPAHAAPNAAEKSASFSLYSSYHDLEVVKPYVNRSEFKAAVHGHVIDTTDFAFYRANKNALRVVDKVIDDVSLAETLVRADSYRDTLAEKAAKYQADIHTKFIDPNVGMIPHGGPLGASYDQMWESGDGSLWTAVYLGSQYFRFATTGEQEALTNVAKTLDAMLKLQEITNDWGHFARTLRKPRGASGDWHAGTGAFANLEWLAGGNNDMIKGLFYAYFLGWAALCEGGKTGYESLCARVRTNVKHLADDVVLGGSNALASQQTNQTLASWMTAIVSTDPSEQLSYRLKAEGYWTVVKTGVAFTPVYYSQGIVDWSGTHLTFVGDVLAMEMSKRLNLGGDATSVYTAHIDASHKNLEKQRFPTWHLIKAAYGTNPTPPSAWVQAAVSRLIETQVPKVAFDVDLRLGADFCMSPYPAVPWKGDWMQYPQEDRTQGLNSYPLFVSGPGINYWMTGNDYRQGGNWEAPGSDYLHLYWFARKFALISAQD